MARLNRKRIRLSLIVSMSYMEFRTDNSSTNSKTMNRDNAADKVKDIVIQKVKTFAYPEASKEPEIKESTSLREELGLDSLDIAELSLEIEDALSECTSYSVVIADEILDRVVTVGDLIEAARKGAFNV